MTDSHATQEGRRGRCQLREVWTKIFKSSADAEDDVQEDDVEMTVEGGVSSWLEEI